MTPTDDLQKEIEAKAELEMGEMIKSYRSSFGEEPTDNASKFYLFRIGYRSALESRPADVTALALENALLKSTIESLATALEDLTFCKICVRENVARTTAFMNVARDFAVKMTALARVEAAERGEL